MTEQAETPGWETIIRLALEGALAGVRTTLPGVIAAYDKTTQLASVQPLIKEMQLTEGGKTEMVEIPQTHTAPVMFVGPGRGRITFPVKVGDPCILWFSSSCLSQWKQRKVNKPVDEKNLRHHDLSDAIAMVGLYSAAPTDAPDDAVVVHLDDDIDLKLGGSDATELVAWHSAMTQLKTAFDEWTPVTNDGGAALKAKLMTLIEGGWPHGSSKVRSK